MVSNGRTDDGDLWSHRRIEVFKRDRWRCRCCDWEEETRAGKDLRAHHAQLDSKGGSDRPWNLRTLCRRCHHAVHRYGDGDVLPPSLLDDVPNYTPVTDGEVLSGTPEEWDTIRDTYIECRKGQSDRPNEKRTVAFRDQRYSSFLDTLDSEPLLAERINEHAERYLWGDVSCNDPDRSVLTKNLIRVGLSTVAPTVFSQLLDAEQEYGRWKEAGDPGIRMDFLSELEANPTVAARDPDMAALMRALEHPSQAEVRKEVGQKLAKTTGKDPDRFDDFSKSDMMNMVFESAMRMIDPGLEEMERILREGYDVNGPRREDRF